MELLLRREAAARRPKSKRSGREEEREESGPAVPGEDSMEASRDSGKAEKTGWKAKRGKANI